MIQNDQESLGNSVEGPEYGCHYLDKGEDIGCRLSSTRVQLRPQRPSGGGRQEAFPEMVKAAVWGVVGVNLETTFYVNQEC